MATRYFNPWARNPKRKNPKRKNPKKRNPKSKRSNPFASGKTIDAPKGKRSGEVFRRGSKYYMVISYRHPKTNKLVRYARPYKGLSKQTRKTGKSKFCPVVSSTKKKSRSRRVCSTANVSIPKGKRSGDNFTKGGRKFVVVSYVNKHGTRTRYARQIKK